MSNYSQPGYGGQYYSPTPPPAGPYGGYPPPTYLQPHPQATMVLVLGILAFVVSGITGPFAWYIGSKARAEMAANPGRWADSSALTIGWVLGIISTVLLIIGVVFLIIYLIFIVFMMAAYSTY